MFKDFIQLFYELIVIGKTAAKDIQMGSDARARKLITKYYELDDIGRLKRVCLKKHIYLSEDAIIGTAIIDSKKRGVIVSLDYIINSRQVYRELIRCKRTRKG